MAAGRIEGAPLGCVLAVGGWDPTMGAGVGADVLAVGMCGARARAAVAVLTAQGGPGAVLVEPVAPSLLVAQMQRATHGVVLGAVKTGALGGAAAVRCVAGFVREHPRASLVVDPVIGASAGGRLLDDEGVRALVSELLPLATLVTPNLSEAAILSGEGGSISDREGMARAAGRILETGVRWVLVKGGHLEGDPADLLEGADGTTEWLEGSRIAVTGTHGTGCVLGAAIAAHLALGRTVPSSCVRARAFLRRALERHTGPDPAPDPMGSLWHED